MILGANPHSYINKLIDFIICYSKIFKIVKIVMMKYLPTAAIPKKIDEQNMNLTELMDKYGSDKGTFHGYTNIYENILNKKRHNIELVLEIGIGTNDPNLPSTMGKYGKPGASLRAWRDYLPNAQIVGLDVDRKIFFTEKSLETKYVNQLSPKTFGPITKVLPKSIDLVVVDGLHTPRADFNSLVALLPFMSSNGDFFIEDIGNLAMILFWPPILLILKKSYKVNIYACNAGHLIHLTRRK